MDSNKIKVNIAGSSYTIIGEKSKEEVEEIAEFVNDEIYKITSQNYRLNPTMAATLVALNISSDFFDLKKELENIREDRGYPIKKQEELIKANEKNEIEKSALLDEINELKNKNFILTETIKNIEKRYENLEKFSYDSFNEVKIKNERIVTLQNDIIKIKDEYIKRFVKSNEDLKNNEK